MGLKKAGISKSLHISTWREVKWENTDPLGREVIQHSTVYQAVYLAMSKRKELIRKQWWTAHSKKDFRRDHFPSILARQNTFPIAPYKPAVWHPLSYFILSATNRDTPTAAVYEILVLCVENQGNTTGRDRRGHTWFFLPRLTWTESNIPHAPSSH